jgi:hypothetical protein
MKNTRIGVLILLMVLIGSCATLAVATPITNLGEIDYYNTQNNFIVNDTIPGNVNLTFVYSEMNESLLIYEKVWYGDNMTTYKFTTSKTYVDWWFTPGIRYFVYQDIGTNELYSVGVNYTNIDIPENPYEERHQQIVENYTLIMNNYNLTNATLANITLQFNELNDHYIQIWQMLNITQMAYLDTSKNLTKIETEFDELEEKYNRTETMWLSAVVNASDYKLDYDDLSEDYNQLKKDKDDMSGAMPWYIIIAIIGTFLFTYIYAHRKTIFGPPFKQETTDEITIGYGKIHSAIDKHILSWFKKEPETDEGGIEEVIKEEFTDNEKQKIEKSLEDAKEGRVTPLHMLEETLDTSAKELTHDEILDIMHKKIDANNREMNTKIDMSIKEVNEKIDNIIKDKGK